MLPAFGLYSHIRANRIRSVLLLAGLFPLGLALAFAGALLARGLTDSVPAGYRKGDLSGFLAGALHDLWWVAPLAFIGAGLWIAFAFRVHQAIIDATTGSYEIGRERHPHLYGLVENLCIARGLAVPRLRIMKSEALNAFASGLTPEQSTITVTTGLLGALNDAELEAVLAHELTHIRNDDVRTMTIAVVVVGIMSFVGELVFRAPRLIEIRGRDKKSGGAVAAIMIAIAIMAVVWALSQVIKFALSRSREYLADAGSVELTKNPDAMISALVKIRGRGELEGVPSGIMELCVDNPRSGFVDLFATHPSIDSRIAALARYAGGHAPDAVGVPPPVETRMAPDQPEIAPQAEVASPEPVPSFIPQAPAGGTTPLNSPFVPGSWPRR